MGFLRGIKTIDTYIEKEEEKRNSRAQKVTYLSLKDGEAVKVTFLQELDPDSPNFSEKNDLGMVSVEHTAGANFRKSALCTMDDEGKCWACEQHRATGYKEGWGQKNKLYINVLVDNGKDTPYVALMQQSKTFLNLLLEYAKDEDSPSITDKVFNLKRKGEKTDTVYLLRPGADSKINVEDYELFDIKQVVREFSYAQQEAYYLDGDSAKEEEPVAAAPAAGALASSSEW